MQYPQWRLKIRSIFLPIINWKWQKWLEMEPRISMSGDTDYLSYRFIFLKTHTHTHRHKTKKPLSLWRIWLNRFKIILPKEIKNRHVDHLFQEWFYTDVSQYILGLILQDKLRSLAREWTMYYYTIVKKCVTISRVHSLFHGLQILSPTLSAFQSAVLFSPAFIPSQKHCH